jgi:hypothetical protein
MEAAVEGQASALPGGFEDLEPFVGEWGGLGTQNERHARRGALPMTRLAAYYDTVAPRLKAIFDHLDGFAFDAPLPEREAVLWRLVLGMTEVAQAIEALGQPEVAHAPRDQSIALERLARV